MIAHPRCECGRNIYDGADECTICAKPSGAARFIAEARAALARSAERDEWRTKKAERQQRRRGGS